MYKNKKIYLSDKFMAVHLAVCEYIYIIFCLKNNIFSLLVR